VPLIDTILLILLAGFLAWEIDMDKPEPYPIVGTGDTLMVRITGYSFCPKHCDVNHHHFGHFTDYDCEEDICAHITINNEK
tara:strand:- start:731 stop:973 length:243 start_codon:yes stop_codon:yes gene_type:complete